jgi:hypothetical protein
MWIEKFLGCIVREIIDQLLQGKYVYTQRNLDFSTPRIELSMGPGENVEGSFTVFGPENALVEGRVTSSDLRMEVLNQEFSGSPYEVSYIFSSEGMSQGDVLKGNFRIISNQGEYVLPFVVTIRAYVVASSLGDIKNLFHFANLAKTDWDEAVDLFYSREFLSVFKGNDAQYESLYRGLSENPDNVQNVEEFLIAINKKQPVSYILDTQELHIEYNGTFTEKGITVTKNGWGYTHLDISIDADFIALDRYELSDDDFASSSARLRLKLRTDRLHEGNNYGRIRLFNSFTEVILPVTVSVRIQGQHLTADYQEMKRLVVQLIKVYENFGCKKITSRAWLSETGKIISRMNAIDDRDLTTRLYTAQYYITAGRVAEGRRILDEAASEAREARGDTLYSYYLYLSTLCSREDSYINDIAGQLQDIFKRNPDNWRIAWLLLYVSEEYTISSSGKWMMLEQQFNYGCRSPIIYLEAMNLLNEEPSMLTKLSEFELYVLMYGARRQIISLNLIDQVVHLGSRFRSFDKRLFTILKGCYEVKENDEVLEAIVALLIKGERTKPEDFEWYRKGVERELRITKLYEYYMMSIYTDENGLLPCDINKMVLMYFSYQSDLEYDKNAILYRYIHEHRQDYPELYESYVSQIEKFLMTQLDKGRINRDLGYLYKNLLTRQMVDGSNASKVLTVLYTSEIRVDDKRISSVCVIYDKCEGAMRYPVVDGSAYVPLYGSDYAVLLTDHDDNRYAASIPYTTAKLMLPGKLSAYAIPYIQKGKENLDLFLCDLGRNAYTIDLDNVGRYKDLAESAFVRRECRNEIAGNLVRFYYDNDFTRQLTEYLMKIDPKDLSSKGRGDMLELMVLSGLYDRALEWVKTYGTYGIDPKIILRLCVRLLDRGAFEPEAKELEIAFYAFRSGKYDEQLLSFLLTHYNGTVREMRDIWKAAESFGLDTYGISERILVQMLYSGSYIGEKMEIYKNYVRSGANADIEMAFLSQSCFDSFVRGTVVDRFVFDRVEKLSQENMPLSEVCYLAYLKYYATDRKADEKVNEKVASVFLRQLMAREVFFPFFQEYSGLLPDMVQFIDKTMLEYRTTPGTLCKVHYRMDDDPGDEYKVMEMRQMYEGINVAEFVLFFGEQMQYYITEETDEGEVLTESGNITKSDIVGSQIPGRFSLINDIMIGETLQDYDTVDGLIGEYYKKKYICDKLFAALDTEGGEEG